jgi:hypothetical protein
MTEGTFHFKGNFGPRKGMGMDRRFKLNFTVYVTKKIRLDLIFFSHAQ